MPDAAFGETVGIYPSTGDLAGTSSPAGQSDYCTSFNLIGTDDGIFEILTNETQIDGSLTGGDIEPRMVPQLNGSGGVDSYCQKGNTVDGALKYLPSTCRGHNTS